MRFLILPLLTFLTACATETTFIKPDIPSETLTPCPISERQVQTVNELAVLATEHLRSATCANGKIEAIAEVLG
jgi:type IV pilus biogenesis protein CpaD/CtpE